MLPFQASWELGGNCLWTRIRFVTSMSGVIHFDKLDSHTLAIYKWEARCADRCFAWKFSKTHSLGMLAVHIEKGKVLEPSEVW